MTKPNKGTGKTRHPATAILHSGRNPADQHGFVNAPAYRGSTVLFPTLDELDAYERQPFRYGRYGTPTTVALETALTELEGGERTLLTPSGYQAVTTAILAFVGAGDHLLMVDSVYQPTRKFCDTLLARLGVTTTYYDPLIGGGIAELIQPNTRVVFLESPGSLTFEMQDVPAIVKAARARDVTVLMDNTWAGPLYFRPLSHGVDVSITACTKYVVGHADAMLGAITANARTAGAVEAARTVLGSCPGSEETYLGLRGLRTLAVRLDRHQRSALEVARWLGTRPEVERILHPALPSDPGHALWKALYTGASGLFSVILKPAPRKALAAMLDGLELFGMGYSWGGYESLIVPFNPKRYRTATAWTAEGPALRLHIGLDDVGDLIADLEAGFARLNAAR
ncbi:cystathionine beta-lyase [Hyphomicrobium sp.]|uniref:cystathionine beta-lyase n=1 Tax=Hyphomicrobium sp. TaxID=82 RepID=UPI0025C1D69D|nr:cystathionine beta-lyase [Hyphomicrobium sp.]MCC7251347.1 cystathionine beta-lyase [Hyphomicrobium sp.]